MASKTVTRRQSTSSQVEAAAREHAAEVAARLAPAFAPGPEPEGAALDLRTLQLRLAGLLAADRQALEAADAAHIEELRGDAGPRRRRDAAAAFLYTAVGRIRGLVGHAFWEGDAARHLGIRGETSRNPEVLRRQAAQVIARLRDAADPLPPPSNPAMRIDPEAWAAGLERPLAELTAALAECATDRRRAEVTLRRKLEALAQVERTLSAVTGILSGLYRLAGLAAYARRLRPAARRTAAGAEAAEAAEGRTRAA